MRTPQRKGEYKVGLLDWIFLDLHTSMTNKKIKQLEKRVRQQEQASIDSKMYKYIYPEKSAFVQPKEKRTLNGKPTRLLGNVDKEDLERMQGRTGHFKIKQEELEYLVDIQFPYYIDLNLDGTATVFCKYENSFYFFCVLEQKRNIKELEEKGQTE